MARFPQRVLGPAPGAEAVALRGEIHLEDRFQDVPQRPLHAAVAPRRDAQRSFLLAARLGDPSPPSRLRTIAPGAQLFVQPLKLCFGVPPEMRHGLSVRSRAPAVAPHLLEGALQIGGRIGLIRQGEPDPVC